MAPAAISFAAAITGGARCYLRWDAPRSQLVAVLAHMLARAPAPTPPRAPTDPEVRLTERELDQQR